jgi:hypothetical protein
VKLRQPAGEKINFAPSGFFESRTAIAPLMVRAVSMQLAPVSEYDDFTQGPMIESLFMVIVSSMVAKVLTNADD